MQNINSRPHPTQAVDEEEGEVSSLTPLLPPASGRPGPKERFHPAPLSQPTGPIQNGESSPITEDVAIRLTDGKPRKLVDEKQRALSGFSFVDRGTLMHRLLKWTLGWLPRSRRAALGGPLISGLLYCLSSISMIMLNKLVLSGYRWEAQISLMLYQNLVSVTVVILLSLLGIVQTERLTMKLVMIWAPVNLIFIGMLVTSFFSLQHMQVAMVTVLKNITNIVTAVGEMYLFRKRHSMRVWGSLLLMIVSAVCGGITDLSFHAVGYTWQMFNCLFTAAYSLTLRKVMDEAKAASKTGTISEFTMVLLNNSLSFPPAIILILLFGEVNYVMTSPLLHNPTFWAIATLSGLLGLAISFTSMWFLHQTSPTTYSLVGSLNKIPLSILGIILFRAPTSVANISSIMFGCFAGVLFARAKMAG